MKILIFTTSEGHRSIADAVHSYLNQNKFSSEICFIEEPGLNFYRFIYKHSPKSFQIFFKLSYTRIADIFLNSVLMKEHYLTVRGNILKHHPQVVISTSFGFTPALTKIKTEFPSIKFINIIPNPRSFFFQDIADSADINCVFDNQMELDIKKLKPKTKTLTTGWFVRNEFVPVNKTLAKTNLNLPQDNLTFLIVAGSEGTQKIFDSVKRLLNFPTALNIVVACGHNQQLLKKVQVINVPEHLTLTAIPFTKEIYKYMQAADLVIGKAGPNMIFESVATHTPFFATTHVGGLEDGNLSIIDEYQIGQVEENTKEADKALHLLATHPELLKKFKLNVSKLAQFNQVQRKKLIQQLLTF